VEVRVLSTAPVNSYLLLLFGLDCVPNEETTGAPFVLSFLGFLFSRLLLCSRCAITDHLSVEVSAHIESVGLVYSALVERPSSVRWPSFSVARLNGLPAKGILLASVELADLRAVVSILSNDECRAA
jgi:hypothetical protein